MGERLEHMEGLAPAGLPWVSACGERRCQSHLQRLKSQPEQEAGPTKTKTKVLAGWLTAAKQNLTTSVLPRESVIGTGEATVERFP